MSKHTPGPWRKQGNIIWGAEIQKQVATVSRLPRETGLTAATEESSNANLIAAAPEILEALERLVRVCEDGLRTTIDGDEDAAYENAKNIIAKFCEHGDVCEDERICLNCNKDMSEEIAAAIEWKMEDR